MDYLGETTTDVRRILVPLTRERVRFMRLEENRPPPPLIHLILLYYNFFFIRFILRDSVHGRCQSLVSYMHNLSSLLYINRYSLYYIIIGSKCFWILRHHNTYERPSCKNLYKLRIKMHFAIARHENWT